MVACLLLATGIFAYAVYMTTQRLSVKPESYASLLHLIAKAESNDNYNAYFGNGGNSSIDFTRMSIAQVMQWQKDFVAQGSPSSAVGRYQIINTTLAGLVDELGFSPDQKFDKKTQDAMAIALLERRGSELYVNEELTQEQFAANLAKEWAALPKITGVNPQRSYYAGDGLNESRVEPKDVLDAIEPIEAN
jgi:muramidase (phage lysozyme)